MSEEQTALPREERSIAGPLGSCLVVAILLALAAGGGALFFLREPEPKLTKTGGEWSLSFEGLGSAKLVLGPGCSDLRLARKKNELGSWDALVWLSEGREIEAEVTSNDQDLLINYEIVSPGQSVVLLPQGKCHVVDPQTKPLLKLQRWEGVLGESGRCVVWIYRHIGGKEPDFSDYLVDDGHNFGRPSSGGGMGLSNEGWGFTETYDTARRTAQFVKDKDKDHVAYELVIDGLAEAASLERTYQGEWSAGDPLPQPAGF